MLWSMALGIPMRGGVEIGHAVETAEGDVYGYPALRAYELEDKEARYPRVLVGENLWAHVQEWDITRCQLSGRLTDRELTELGFSTWCRDFLCEDGADGRAMLDYLGKGVRDRADDSDIDRVQDAYAFVRSEHEQFKNGPRKDGNLEARRSAPAVLRITHGPVEVRPEGPEGV